MYAPRNRRRQAGVGLIDVIVAIVVMSIALTAVVSIFVVTTKSSADPMQRQQAQLIAEAYLDEILLKRFLDPSTGTLCPAPEASRVLFDNVCDYNNLNEAPTDQFGNAITNLSTYNVAVVVVTSNVPATLSLNTLNNTGVNKVVRIDITVRRPGAAGPILATLSGYRTNYNCNAVGQPGC